MSKTTYLASVLPEILNIDTSELKLAYLTSDGRLVTGYIPIIWAYYREELLYCEVDYNFSLLETYDDWKLTNGNDFNPYSPGDEELSHLLKYKIKYHLFLPEMFASEEVQLNLCKVESDIIKNWMRNKKLNELLK